MDKKIYLWKNNTTSYITPFLLPGDQIRPFVLIIPGGGYLYVCSPSEGAPVARKFNQLGFHAAVLNYRTRPNYFPAPVEDAVRAMRIIRGSAEQWRIDPDTIAVCGFSAGAHLAACLGTTIAERVTADALDRFDQICFLPDFMILSYGVLTFANGRNSSSAENLIGSESTDEKKMNLSPEKCITGRTPPAFIWHTFTDQMVPFDSSIRFAKAMTAHHRPCELHMFPHGAHGMLLGLRTPDISIWPTLAKRFIIAQKKYSLILAKRYTNQYQCRMEKAYPGPEKNK